MIIEGGLMFDKGGHSRHADTPSINFFTAATLRCRKMNLIVVVFCSSNTIIYTIGKLFAFMIWAVAFSFFRTIAQHTSG